MRLAAFRANKFDLFESKAKETNCSRGLNEGTGGGSALSFDSACLIFARISVHSSADRDNSGSTIDSPFKNMKAARFSSPKVVVNFMSPSNRSATNPLRVAKVRLKNFANPK